ncbi:1,2-phenylacetyl-CoA epoxidase subunit PaaC [uncultured Roseobacter sp.]|uniref:1,2-phenylacetyl-CoA epoxidase subunit PaaC n=1 Tax=uncultured Roseobacter sp. TaxID=114847 RepID=UPI00260BA6EE|nr:1,2-phenylacetyl-CoA epoxidase subunit PaaC [uncultured Roseobacter sp.]
MGDNALVLGHRVSEWCGVAPALEEDIALANTALDLVGQATLWLDLAAEVEGAGRDADALAFRRDVWDFRNLLLVEQPNGDFGQTMMRQFLFDAWHRAYLAALTDSSDTRIAAIAEKSLKEVTYHLDRSAETVIGLGDGTEESHRRMQTALDRLFPFVGEMFVTDEVDAAMITACIAPDPRSLRAGFDSYLAEVLAEAKLIQPSGDFSHKGGKSGARHSEHLGHMLTQMQWLQRAYPDATW